MNLLLLMLTLLLISSRTSGNPVPPPPICRPPFQPIRGLPNCYIKFVEKLNFDSAQAKCRSLGGKLPEPKSDLENRFVGPSRYYWIGIKEINGHWAYDSDRSPIVWKPHEHHLFYYKVTYFDNF